MGHDIPSHLTYEHFFPFIETETTIVFNTYKLDIFSGFEVIDCF